MLGTAKNSKTRRYLLQKASLLEEQLVDRVLVPAPALHDALLVREHVSHDSLGQRRQDPVRMLPLERLPQPHQVVEEPLHRRQLHALRLLMLLTLVPVLLLMNMTILVLRLTRRSIGGVPVINIGSRSISFSF